MITAVYPGTFDPFHNGHLHIAKRAMALFDRLILGVYIAPSKQMLFTHAERIALAHEALAPLNHDNRVSVIGYSGLTVHFARQQGAQVIIRGLRNGVDFDFEWQMAQTNHWLASDVEIVCLFANEPHTFVSATLVREVATLGGDVSELVPPCVSTAIIKKRQLTQVKPQEAIVTAGRNSNAVSSTG
ncbi:MAG: pantetheine-phosphate adenylyltransferase [Chloroflexi bacterium]|nr:pantetheine-phosphate adenylyltransferase [Chloroflexota bacterium]